MKRIFPNSQKITHHIETSKKYITERSEVFVGVGVVAVLAAVVGIVVLIVNLNGPNIVYQPSKACDLFTPAEAQSLLGDRVISVDTTKEPQISGSVATSKCSYTNETADATNIIVAAVAVRSGINDEGVIKNSDDFAAAKANNSSGSIQGIGESAYFNQSVGQLNVLDKKNWIIISYGYGASPESNTPEKAVELARLVLDK